MQPSPQTRRWGKREPPFYWLHLPRAAHPYLRAGGAVGEKLIWVSNATDSRCAHEGSIDYLEELFSPFAVCASMSRDSKLLGFFKNNFPVKLLFCSREARLGSLGHHSGILPYLDFVFFQLYLSEDMSP